MAHEGWISSFLLYGFIEADKLRKTGHGRSEEDDGGVGPGWFWPSIKWAQNARESVEMWPSETEVGRYGDDFVSFLEIAIHAAPRQGPPAPSLQGVICSSS